MESRGALSAFHRLISRSRVHSEYFFLSFQTKKLTCSCSMKVHSLKHWPKKMPSRDIFARFKKSLMRRISRKRKPRLYDYGEKLG